MVIQGSLDKASLRTMLSVVDYLRHQQRPADTDRWDTFISVVYNYSYYREVIVINHYYIDYTNLTMSLFCLFIFGCSGFMYLFIN